MANREQRGNKEKKKPKAGEKDKAKPTPGGFTAPASSRKPPKGKTG